MANSRSQLPVPKTLLLNGRSSWVMILLTILVTCTWTTRCSGNSYEVVKSTLYPHLQSGGGLKSFRDPPGHGPAVAIQVWYSDSRVFGLQTTFFDNHTGPLHGYAVGKTGKTICDPGSNSYFTAMGSLFTNTDADGTIAVGAVGFLVSDPTAGEVNVPVSGSGQDIPDEDVPNKSFVFGAPADYPATSIGGLAIILGLLGTVDSKGIAQVGPITQARHLSFKQTASGRGSLYWPKELVVRSPATPRLPTGLRPFDDGVTGEHGQVVTVQLWTDTDGVLGIRATFEDGFRSPVYGFTNGKSVTLSFDPKTNPLVAVGGRGGSYPNSGSTNESGALYQLIGLAFFAGISSPPVRSPIYGSEQVLAYSDSADGKIVGFFGQLSNSRLVQLGVHVVSPANSLVVISSGPFPRVIPPAAYPFDHTGDNIGVSKIDIYYSISIGILGLRFTYVTRQGVLYTTPLYGQKRGLYKQVFFDYVKNPLMNLAVCISNVLAGTGEVGVLGLNFRTLKGESIGSFGTFQASFSNLTDGSRRVVGFHGAADTVINSIGVYTAPLK